MKNTTGALKCILKNKRGESMVVVMGLMLVFFVLGASILTAASSATATTSARWINRQADVYATSALSALDASMRSDENGLGVHMRNKVLAGLESDNSFSVTDTLSPTVGFEFDGSDTTLLAGLSIENVELEYTGSGSVLLRDNEDKILEAAIQLTDVQLSFDVDYNGRTRHMKAVYGYSGGVSRALATQDYTISGAWSIKTIE